MNGLGAIAAAHVPLASRASRWPYVAGIPSTASSYLRGLTVGRVGLVLLLCTVLSMRQLSACMSINYAVCVDTVLGGHIFAGSARFLARQFISALPMLLLITLADNSSARSGQSARVGIFCAAVLLGGLAYAWAFNYTQPDRFRAGVIVPWNIFGLMQFSRALLYGGLGAAVLFFFARERNHARALQESRVAKTALDRQMIEARLQVLQAQIEPHFLFNTLANVRTLYEVDPGRARSLIHDFAAYLRAALPQIRSAESTVGRELALAQAYLGVLKVRMGERLGITIDVPADLHNAGLPPLMLSTLLENAIKHGVNPRPSGGRIVVSAERRGPALRIVVSDDGVGFQQYNGTGVGLANTRARLASLYGDTGRLTLSTNAEGGVSAAIEVPYRAATAHEATS